MCGSVMQCVAVCCSVLQFAVERCRVLQLHFVAACSNERLTRQHVRQHTWRVCVMCERMKPREEDCESTWMTDKSGLIFFIFFIIIFLCTVGSTKLMTSLILAGRRLCDSVRVCVSCFGGYDCVRVGCGCSGLV